MLKMSGLTKRFDGVCAVDDVSLHIDGGIVTGLIGPNGAGKSTLFNIVSGFIRPDAGTVTFKNKAIHRSAPHSIAANGIGRTFQNVRVISRISVLDNVILASKRHEEWSIFRWRHTKRLESGNRDKAMQLLDFAGLKDKADEYAGNLSYGQQKLLNLACCRAMESNLLLLDEPFAGVNPEMMARISDLIRELRNDSVGIFLIEHNIEELMKISERLIVMDEGRIIADGEPQQVREDPAVLEAYLG